MKLIRISALVLTGAVAVALTACEPKDEAGSSGKDDSVSSDKGKDDDSGNDEAGDGKEESAGSLGEVSALTVTKSGGISGMEETLEVDAKGNWEYVKARMAPKQGELSDKELDKLTGLATDGRITDKGKKSDKQCNDMQTYSLVVELEKGDKVEANTDECGVSPNEQFDDLMKLLGEATPI